MVGNLFAVRTLLWSAMWAVPIGLLHAGPATAEDADASIKTRANAVTVFGGILTDNSFEDFLLEPWTATFEEAGLAGLAASRRLWRFRDWFSIEVEGQVVRNFGNQDHWEFNLPVAGRWEAFPWDDVIETSLAWGIGPSYASEVPNLEVIQEGSSQRWLVYWFAEVELGLPDRAWSVIGRIHHRSEAFGIVADKGGSNALAIGLKWRF